MKVMFVLPKNGLIDILTPQTNNFYGHNSVVK